MTPVFKPKPTAPPAPSALINLRFPVSGAMGSDAMGSRFIWSCLFNVVSCVGFFVLNIQRKPVFAQVKT